MRAQHPPLDRIEIGALDLSGRALGRLRYARIHTVAQLVNCSLEDLCCIRQMAETTIQEILVKLNAYLSRMMQTCGQESQTSSSPSDRYDRSARSDPRRVPELGKLRRIMEAVAPLLPELTAPLPRETLYGVQVDYLPNGELLAPVQPAPMPREPEHEPLVDYLSHVEPYSVLRRTILDLVHNITTEERGRVAMAFGNIQCSKLELEQEEAERLSRYHVGLHDSMKNILRLPLGVFCEIWTSEARFKETQVALLDLIAEQIGRLEQPRTGGLANDLPILPGFQFHGLEQLIISPTFVQRDALRQLRDAGFVRWRDAFGVSERQVLSGQGLSWHALHLMNLLWGLRPEAERMTEGIDSTDKNAVTSFDAMVRSWLLISKTMRQNGRDIDLLVQRKGWGSTSAQTLEAVGLEHGITRERVRQIQKKAEGSIRHPLNGRKSMYHPLWITIDSLLQDSCGIVSVSELGARMQACFGWEEAPSDSGLVNLVEFMPKRLSEAFAYHAPSAALVSKQGTCVGCAAVADHIREAVICMKEVDKAGVFAALNKYCGDHCVALSGPRFELPESFLDWLIAARDDVRKALTSRGINSSAGGSWTPKYQTTVSALEAIVKSKNGPIHFTEVVRLFREMRPGSDIISERYVHSALSQSNQVLLWDRGTFVHTDNVRIPELLLQEIETWVVGQLETGLPFMSVYGVFESFEEPCIRSGVPLETALYTCLRRTSKGLLQFPRYPHIVLGRGLAQRVPVSVLVEQYVEDAGGPVAIKELRQHFVVEIGLKDFQLSNALRDFANVIRVSPGTY